MNSTDMRARDSEADEIRNRSFVAIATANYDDPNFSGLPVRAELAELRAWLCDRERLGDRAFEVPPQFARLAEDPSYLDIRGALCDPAEPWTFQDAAVVFVTGHGQMEHGDHWTVLKKSTIGELALRSLRTVDLIAWLAATQIEHLLLIIDTCFAGAIASAVFKRDRPLPASWLILPSATKAEMAVTGALTNAIRQAVDKLRTAEGAKFGVSNRYFTPTEFIDTIKQFLEPGQTVVHYFRGLAGQPHMCLPNPHFAASTMVPTERSRHELALPKEDLDTHWSPRARGAADRRGWLFAGRAELMRELIGTATGPAGTTLVTGTAGCGKSAVLARLVTLSDPEFRTAYQREVAAIPDDLLPPESAVDVAVVASRKWPHEVLGQICEALGVRRDVRLAGDAVSLEQRIQAWTDWLQVRTEPVTIVVDALDEAQNPRDIADLLIKLTANYNGEKVRLLVGVRSAGGAAGAAEDGHTLPVADEIEASLHARRLRVDDHPWWHDDDVRAYASSILRNSFRSPYAAAEQHELAEHLAGLIAGRSGSSFLTARIAATSMAARDQVLDPGDEQWLAAIDNGVVGVFRDDLWQSLPHDPSRRDSAITLLRAVAYAYGRGLPWGDIWPAVANAIAGRPSKYGDRDIADLLDSRLSAYLVTDTEDGVTVYRLFHEVLRTTLRSDWRQLLVDPNTLRRPGG